MNISIEESVRRIKQTVDWFPGVVLGLKRQVGKTQAILELIHERHRGDAFILSPSQIQAEGASRRYRLLYPKDNEAKCISQAKLTHGLAWPIYVDEWWFLSQQEKKEIMGTGRVVLQIGTMFEERSQR